RLFKEGWFLDPDLSEQIFTHDGMNSREVGPYRQIFMEGVPDGIPSPYHLNIDDMASKVFETIPLTPIQKTPLTTIWNLVRRYREQSTNASADIAIENFHRSYGF